MDIEITYTIKLDANQAAVLKRVLGGLNDNEFGALGVRGEDRQRMSDLWDLLPDIEEEE